jgi:periplasmic divalent cation tolerance protein
MSFALIYITHSSEAEAQRVSQHLLERKLIACTNIFPITSAYWWQGMIQNECEWVSIVKTTLESFEGVKTQVEKVHSYEVPCILKITVEANAAYEQWIADSVLPPVER